MRIERTLIKNDNNKTLFLIADLFRLFSRSTPLKILHSVRDKEMTLSEISKSLQMTQKAVLPELTVLQNKDILASLSRSQKTFYRLADERILRAMDLINNISLKRARQSKIKNPAHKASRNSQRRGA
jgi:DNA-binding transcriptional ArsR family regulator